MRVGAERLRVEILLSQSTPPPQCDSSPRLLSTVDTGSDDARTPRWSPAIGMGSDEPGVWRPESWSTEREVFLPLQASVDVFLRVNSTSPEQECTLLRPDIEVDDEDKTTTSTSQQAACREEFARLPIGRQLDLPG